MNLPFQARLVDNNGHHTIIDHPIPATGRCSIRTAIIWDKDRDERILDVYTAISYRDMLARTHLLALAETNGIVTAYLGGIEERDLAKLQQSIQQATTMAVLPNDHWTVAPIQLLPLRKNGLVDAKALPPDSPLLKAASTFGLGQVRS